MKEQQEIVFAATLEKIKKQAREQGNVIAPQQVEEAFSDLQLSKEQLQMVIDYLGRYKIKVGEQVADEESLSEEDINYLQEYERELALLEAISDGEREALILSAMAGENQAQQKLISVFLPKVLDISRLYSGQGVLLEDLIGEGNVALTVGVTMLGCLENAKEAEGMLGKMIMDAMENSIAESMQEAEREQKVLARVNKVAEKAKELAQDMHRKVTVSELAAETGMSEKSIADAMRMSGYAIEDLEG